MDTQFFRTTVKNKIKTQKQIADEIGIDAATLSQIMRGVEPGKTVKGKIEKWIHNVNHNVL